MSNRSRAQTVAFYSLASIIALPSLWMANQPFAILFGKILHPKIDLVLRIGLKIELPVLLVACLSLFFAVRQFRNASAPWVSFFLLAFAPLITAATLYFLLANVVP